MRQRDGRGQFDSGDGRCLGECSEARALRAGRAARRAPRQCSERRGACPPQWQEGEQKGQTVKRNDLLAARRGWIQIFLVMFFVLLVVIGVVLLTLEKGKLDPQDPNFVSDIMDQKASATLVSLLRTPSGLQLEGQPATIADLIIMDRDGVHDQEMTKAMDRLFPAKDQYLQLSIIYPSGKAIMVSNSGAYVSTPGFTAVGADFAGWAQGTANGYLPSTGGNIALRFTMIPIDPALKLPVTAFTYEATTGSAQSLQKADSASQNAQTSADSSKILMPLGR